MIYFETQKDYDAFLELVREAERAKSEAGQILGNAFAVLYERIGRSYAMIGQG